MFVSIFIDQVVGSAMVQVMVPQRSAICRCVVV